MKSIEPLAALKLRKTAIFAAVWGTHFVSGHLLDRGLEERCSIYPGKLYKKMNKAKLDCNPERNKTEGSMPCLPLIGLKFCTRQSGHPRSRTRAFDDVSLNLTRPDSTLRSSSHTGHLFRAVPPFTVEQYHYSGPISVTEATHAFQRASATIPLIRACRNELYNVTPMRRKNA